MPREDLSKNLVGKFFPDLEEKIKEIFTEVRNAGGSFERGNIRYEVEGDCCSNADLYKKLIELYSVDCRVDVDDECGGVIDGIYVICDNHKVFVMVDLHENQLAISAWVK